LVQVELPRYLKVTGVFVIENNWDILLARVVLTKAKKDELLTIRAAVPAPLSCASTFESLGEDNIVSVAIASMSREGASGNLYTIPIPKYTLVTIRPLLPRSMLGFVYGGW
jgi:hypothetical protein